MILNDATLEKFGYNSQDIGKFSKNILVMKCDHCGIVFEKTSNRIHMCRRNSKSEVDVCTDVECIKWKREMSMLKMFGVKNAGLSAELREKARRTCRERFGEANPMSAPIVQRLSRDGCKRKYGVENVFQSELIKSKIRRKNLLRYGVEHASQRSDVKEKKAKTFRDRWNGCGNASSDIYNRTKLTCQKLYGGVGLSSPTLYEKARNTSRTNYGTDFPSQSDSVKKKIMDSHVRRYGCHYFQSPKFKEMRKITNIKKYGQENPILSYSRRSRGRMSKFQREVYAEVLNKHSDAIMEYAVTDSITSDIFIPSRNLIIECYGDYWHCNPRKYKSDFFQKNVGLLAADIWERDKRRETAIQESHKLVTIWEMDWKRTGCLPADI